MWEVSTRHTEAWFDPQGHLVVYEPPSAFADRAWADHPRFDYLYKAERYAQELADAPVKFIRNTGKAYGPGEVFAEYETIYIFDIEKPRPMIPLYKYSQLGILDINHLFRMGANARYKPLYLKEAF